MKDSLTLFDKMLPDQPANNHLFHGTDYHRRLFDLACRATGVVPQQTRFRLEVSDKVSIEEMASNPVQLSVLEMLVALTGAKRILEIGTFIGLSAMAMASAMPPDGRLTTVEKFDHFAALARRNIAANGFADRIEVIEGDAFEQLERITAAGPFDLVFIDGNKERYLDYFQALEGAVRPGGLLIVDDALFHGDVLNDRPTTEKGAGCRAVLEAMESRADLRRCLIPFSNGLLLARKGE